MLASSFDEKAFVSLKDLSENTSELGGFSVVYIKCHQIAGTLWQSHKVFKARGEQKLFAIALTFDFLDGFPSKH